MFDKIIAFFMSIITFIMSLFGLNTVKYDSFENISYGEANRQVLDLYIPKENNGTVGLILMIHGGAWIAGDKSAYTDDAKGIAENYGYAAATINYRYLSEDVTMADILDDIESAVAKIKEIGTQNSVDINKMILTGHSAGGHLSMLYSYSKAKTSAITPVAVIDYCGPTDFTDAEFFNSDIGADGIAKLYSWAIGTEVTVNNYLSYSKELLEISPIAYAATAVPTVIAHGEKDATVPYSNATTLVSVLNMANVKNDFISFPNSNHALGNDKDCSDKVTELFIQYANEYLK